MSPMDVTGLCVLAAGTLIAVGELLISGWLWALPPLDPCRERPSALPQERR